MGKGNVSGWSDLAINSFVCQRNLDNDFLSSSGFHFTLPAMPHRAQIVCMTHPAPELLTARTERPIHHRSHYHNQGFRRSIIPRWTHLNFCLSFSTNNISSVFGSDRFILSRSAEKGCSILRIIHGPNGMGYFSMLLDELFTLCSELQFRRSEE